VLGYLCDCLSGRGQRQQVVKVILHKVHRRHRRIRQVAAICPPMRAHWCHLVNTTKLVHTSAHASPQPKWQIDRFSRFCTAHASKYLYFTTGAHIHLIHLNCPFPWGNLDLQLMMPWAHMSPQPKWHLDAFSRLSQMTTGCPYSLEWVNPLPLSMRDLDPM